MSHSFSNSGDFLHFWPLKRLASIHGTSFPSFLVVCNKTVLLCYSDKISTFRCQLCCCRWYPVFRQIVQKSVFLILQAPTKVTLWAKTTVCLPRWQDVLLTHLQISHFTNRNHWSFAANMNALCFTYQQVDYLCTLFKYRFNDKLVFKSRQVLNIEQGAVYFDQKPNGVDKLFCIGKRRLLKKK